MTPSRFRKLPLEVTAVQWFPDPDFGRFDGDRYLNRRVGVDQHKVEYTVCDVGISTLEGFMHIKPGCWIITGIKGERYVCAPDIFAASYEAV